MADTIKHAVVLVRDVETIINARSKCPITSSNWEESIDIECKTEEDAKELFDFLKRFVEKLSKTDKALKVT